MVRSDPVEQIRNTLEQVAAARGLTQVHNEQSYGNIFYHLCVIIFNYES